MSDYAVDLLTRIVKIYSPSGKEEEISLFLVDEMTRLDQQKIRNSPLWDEMAFGEEEAERLLRQFRAEVK